MLKVFAVHSTNCSTKVTFDRNVVMTFFLFKFKMKKKKTVNVSLFPGIHGEPGIKRSKVGKTSHYECFIYLCHEHCLAFFPRLPLQMKW